MVLTPDFSLDNLLKKSVTASRQFTDRDEPKSIFNKAFKEKKAGQLKVLTFYGVGGIGKSRLQRELANKLDELDPSCIKLVLDFKEEKLRTPGDALIWLQKAIRKQAKVDFLTFEIAYAMYWNKLNPQICLKEQALEIPFLEEGNFIGELIQKGLENAPVVEWVPKTLKFISGLPKYKNTIMAWWTGMGKPVVESLQDKLPGEIEKYLPALWARDLQDYLTKNNVPIVIFLDTYEALWEKGRNQGNSHNKDLWIKQFILSLQEALWVIFGREKILWNEVESLGEEYFSQHLIGELSEEDSRKFLESCGIKDEGICNLIIKGSEGLPYYLDLMVDTYNLISESRIPRLEEFADRPVKILERFMYYLDLPEKETIKLLSFPRYWHFELYSELVAHFKTGYPITAYNDLFRFSFINDRDDGGWDMHNLMHVSLQDEIEKTSPILYTKVHRFLFDYHNKQLKGLQVQDITEEIKDSFREAFYHGVQVQREIAFIDWFLCIGKTLQAGGQFSLLVSVIEGVNKSLQQNPSEILKARSYQLFGEVYLLQGNYELAITNLNDGLQIFKGIWLKDTSNLDILKSIAKCTIDLAEINIQITNYQAAYEILHDAEQYYQFHKGNSDEQLLADQALQQIRLGKLNIRFARYEESLKNYEQAISLCDDVFLLNENNAYVYSIKALAFEKMGELFGSKKREKQGEYYKKSIDYYEKALENKGSTNYIRTLTNKGLAHKRLAEHYYSKQNRIESVEHFTQAIDIYDEVLEKSPDFLDALEKKGHALVDLMDVLIAIGKYAEAKETFLRAVETFDHVLNQSSKQASSRNRKGSAYRQLASLYWKEGATLEALECLIEAVNISDEVLIHSPDYIYVHNSRGKTYEKLGDYYCELGNLPEAEKYLSLARDEFNKMLELAPNLVEALERKGDIIDKLAKLDYK